MSEIVIPLHPQGLSLRHAYLPRTLSEKQVITEKHPCAACGATGGYLLGDSGPLRRLEQIAYYRIALKCRCGFMNFAYVVVNDLAEETAGLALPHAEAALKEAADTGKLTDPKVEELLIRTAAAGYKEEWQDAMGLAQQCVDLAPKHPAAWFNLGWLHVACGDFETGLQAYRQTTLLSDDFPSAWLNMGNVYHHLEQYDEALDCLERFLQRYPEHTEANQRRDECLAKASNP